MLSSFDAPSRSSPNALAPTRSPPTRSPRYSYTMPLSEEEQQSSFHPTIPPKAAHGAIGKSPGRKSALWSERRGPSPVEDSDARLVRESLFLSKKGSKNNNIVQQDNEDRDADYEEPLFGSSEEAAVVDRPRNLDSGHYHPPVEPSEMDSSITPDARLAAIYEENKPKSSVNKVMTPSQFEHYRQQKELRGAESDASNSDDDEAIESDFDQEDEEERNRLAEKQRRKQEAHLTVYRQQMMKMTGRQSPPLLPSLRPDASSNNLAAPSPNVAPKAGSGKSSEGDEDEEIPLGILAAHGFPNKNRPPTRIASPAPVSNLRASFQPPFTQPGSEGNNRGSLPAFARNLPADPYFGASLVNLSNRESLAMGGGSPLNAAGTPPTPHPSGLVGVIATEERARATRRGSSSTPPTATPGTTNGVPRPYTMMGPPPPSATDQAQVQLSQQMTNMMQVQMQMMQHLMHMQSGQSAPGSLPVPPSQNGRPVSAQMAGGLSNNPAARASQMDNRTMSMLNPGMVPPLNSSAMPVGRSFNPAAAGSNAPAAGPGYAPSVAPSERSNVGLASRYRPVSTAPVEQGTHARSSTFTSSTLKPLNAANQRKTVMGTTTPQRPLEKTDPNTTVRPTTTYGKPEGVHSRSDDENDEEGWAEMMKKREKKKSNWKLKRGTTTGDLLNTLN